MWAVFGQPKLVNRTLMVHTECGIKSWTFERTFFCRVYLQNGQRYSYNTDIIWKLHHWRLQIYAKFCCGTNHLKVSGTNVNGGEALSCILLGYPELRPTKLLLKEICYGHSPFTWQLRPGVFFPRQPFAGYGKNSLGLKTRFCLAWGAPARKILTFFSPTLPRRG